MVYKQKFVAAVKVDGKILREVDDTVSLPFNSEYSILLKNLETRNALVSISIDGKDVNYGHALILQPNREFDLLGAIQGGQVRNRFKFIQKTKKIQDHRGDRIDDGIIRIEFAFEKLVAVTTSVYHYYPPILGKRGLNDYWSTTCGNISTHDETPRALFTNCVANLPQQNEGITVEGSEVRQDFTYSSIGELDKEEVIILRMIGIEGPALTTKTKLVCNSCGTRSKSYVKFCPECGTYLL